MERFLLLFDEIDDIWLIARQRVAILLQAF